MMEIDNKITQPPYSLLPNWGHVPAQHDHALKRLLRAVIIQAARDAAAEGDISLEAKRWLQSEDCFLFCEFTGINFKAVKAWVMSGCPNWRAS